MSARIAEVLERAADLIEPEGAWTQEVTARDASGSQRLSNDPRAVCFCALGAILKAGGGVVGADDFFGDTLRPGHRWTAVGYWNDAPERTQAEVVAKLREAAALARTQPDPIIDADQGEVR